MIFFAIILIFTFILLATLHIIWAFGIKWGFDKALPTNEKGERTHNPTKFDCVIVGLGLLGFAFFYLLQSEIVIIDLPSWLFDFVGWIIPAIFIIRTVGDFRHIGIFKKLKNTDFGKLDTKYYTPLCLIIGIIGVIIQIMYICS